MTGGKKKGLSIGAAMKQRMDEQAAPEISQPAPSPEPPLDKRVEKTAVQPAAPAEADVLESFNTRLPRGLHRRLKVYAATEGHKLQDVVAQALDEHLRRAEQKES